MVAASRVLSVARGRRGVVPRTRARARKRVVVARGPSRAAHGGAEKVDPTSEGGDQRGREAKANADAGADSDGEEEEEDDDDEDEEDEDRAREAAAAAAILEDRPDWFSTEIAEAQAAAVAKYARNFLPILFNLFVAAPPERRGELSATVGCFAQVTDATSLGGFFRTVLKKLVKVT